MPKALNGQMDLQDLDKIYRRTCKLTGEDNCNIFNAHDVAIEIGDDCKYGCCYSCNISNICGACCNTARHKKYYKNY